MINPVEIIFGVFKQFIPLLLILAAIKVAMILFREWSKPKQFRTTGFPDTIQLNPPDIPTLAPPKPKPVSFASHTTPADKLPYEQRKPLTATEAVLYYRLVKALPECIILPQVQLSRFIKIKNSPWYKRAGKSYALQNRIAQQSVDYLVCLKDFTIVAAVELDDKSHSNPKVKQLDQKKDESLRAAKVELIRWNAEALPTLENIRKKFA